MTRWAAALRTGLLFGLSPPAFWALSVREWRSLIEDTMPDQMTSEDLARLEARFTKTDDRGKEAGTNV